MASVSLPDLSIRLNEAFCFVREHLDPAEFQRVYTPIAGWLRERESSSVMSSEGAQSACLAHVIQTQVDHLEHYLDARR